VLPPYLLGNSVLDSIREYTVRLATALEVCGLINVQYAVQGDQVYVLEVNPRASRTIPFVSKATGIPWAKVGARVMAGARLADLDLAADRVVNDYFVKAVVFPFTKFPGTDTILGPEMRSTGEVMGASDSVGLAIARAFAAAGVRLPESGTVFISVSDQDKPVALKVARELRDLGFQILATQGTAAHLTAAGVDAIHIFKVGEGPRPHVVDRIKNGDVDLIINTPLGRDPHLDDRAIRTEAVARGVPCITTLEGARAAVDGIRAMAEGTLQVKSLQEYHGLQSATFDSIESRV
jgi:carbamoyl-phosphate synthase large subunit